jgi:hypothetical protein
MSSPRAPTVADPTEPRRRARWQAAGALAISAVSVVFAVISLLTVPSGGDLLSTVALDLPAISFATAGAILVGRLPGNLIGWLLLAGGLCFALGNGATGQVSLGSASIPAACLARSGLPG